MARACSSSRGWWSASLCAALVAAAPACGRPAAAPHASSPAAVAAPTERAAVDEVRLGIGSHLVNFGTVGHAALMHHAFELENRTQRTLQLKHAAASCGCTRYEFDKKRWAPGERGTLTLSLDTTHKSGSVYATVGLVLVDEFGVESFERFGVECIVEQSEHLYAEPPVLDFGAVAVGSSAPAEFAIGCLAKSDKPLPERVRFARTAAGASELVLALGDLHVELLADGVMSSSADASERRVVARGRIAWRPRTPDASVARAIELEALFPDGRVEPISVLLRGSIASSVTFRPAGVFVPGLQPGEERTVVVDVEAAVALGDECRLASSDDAIRASWVPVQAAVGASTRRLSITLVAPSGRRSIAGSVELGCGDAAFKLPVSATIR